MPRDTISETASCSSSGLSLAERLQAGSTAAWQDFVRLYGPLVDRWCKEAGVPADAVPDVAQTVFLTAFRKLGGFDSTRTHAHFEVGCGRSRDPGSLITFDVAA